MAGAPANHDVFLSYSRADTAAANALRDRLVADGKLKVFIDWRALAPGRPWQPALEAALLGCRAMLVLVGPKGIGGWQHREIQLGLDRQTGAERTANPFPVIPVLLPGLEPDDYPLGTFLALNTWVAFKGTVDEPLPLQHLLAAIHGQPLDAPRDFASLRPYRGLLAFREQDAKLFFARERFVAELTAKVRQRSRANVVAVLGRSGSGKSSVVFAGLFPALRQEKGVGQQAVWNIASLRPGARPLQALIETFDPPDPSLGDTETLAILKRRADLLRKGEVTLAELVTRRIDKDQGTTRQLLYVDQWEELYTQAQKREPDTDEERARTADARLFIDLLLDAAASSPCTLVFSVRSDFYPDLQTHDRLRAAVQDCQVSLGPMTKAELTAAIEGPAKAVGGSVEPELTKKLLRDIGLDPAKPGADHYDIGKLPLLEYALEQAWAKAKDARLGFAHYAGLEQALEERANAIYDRLPPDQRAVAKRLFVSLVTPGEGREDTRARIVLQDDPILEQVATAFTASDARLIVTGDDAAGAHSAEVSHEALIRHWERLRSWIDENRANLRTRSVLAAARAEWLRQGMDQSLLIEPGLRLEAARQLCSHPGDVVVEDLSDYLKASFGADARRARWRHLALGAASLTAFAMGALALFGLYQYNVANLRAGEAIAAQQEAEVQTRAANIEAIRSRAALLRNEGHFDDAEIAYKRVLAYIDGEASPLPTEKAHIELDLANLYLQVGRSSDAREVVSRVIDRHLSIGNEYDASKLASTRIAIEAARLQEKLGDHIHAFDTYKSTIQPLLLSPSRPKAELAIWISEMARLEPDPEQEIVWLTQARDDMAATMGDDNPATADITDAIAEAYVRSQDYRDALTSGRRARSSWLRGYALPSKYRHDIERQLLRTMTIAQNLSKENSPPLDRSRPDDRIDIREVHDEILLLFQILSFSSFEDASQLPHPAQSDAKATLNQYQYLVNQWSERDRSLELQITDLNIGLTLPPRPQSQIQPFQPEAAISFQAKISVEAPAYSSIYMPTAPVSITEIQQSLGDLEELVLVAAVENRLVSMKVDKHDVSLRISDVPRTQVEGLINSISTPANDVVAGRRWLSDANQLYALMGFDVSLQSAAHATQHKTMLVMPVGILALVPFGALPSSVTDSTGRAATRSLSAGTGTPAPESEQATIGLGFEPGSAHLSRFAELQLDQLGEALNSEALRSLSFVISGHTSFGEVSATDSFKLGEARAAVVIDYLVSRFGIDPIRLIGMSCGNQSPFDASNPSAYTNRRVEVIASNQSAEIACPSSTASYHILGAQYDVAIVPNLGWFRASRQRFCEKETVDSLILAPSVSQDVQFANSHASALPGTGSDAAKLASDFPAATILLNNSVTLGEISGLADRRLGILAFSGHGAPGGTEGSPAPGPILVLGRPDNETQNEYLSADAVLRYRLRADLVMLFSSSSLEDKKADHLPGRFSRLALSFLASGSDLVLGTYSSPPDFGVATFVEQFSSLLSSQLDMRPAEALGRAMDILSTRYPPAVWATYGLIGDPSFRCLRATE